MVRERLLSEKGVKALLNSAKLQNNAEIKAALLEYKSSSTTQKSKIEKDSLSDDSQEIKQALKKQARQEQIQTQDGIGGIVFVASGKLENFGFTDEYTGAHNLSDLKEFIEARGGFLRSAVSSKTDFLICNDTSIRTIKVKKAEELGTKVISEADFLKMAK
jgi:NAD-dependent DNA ligase